MEQKKRQKTCQLGLVMKHSMPARRKNLDFEMGVRGIWGEHVHNPEKKKKNYSGIRVGG